MSVKTSLAWMSLAQVVSFTAQFTASVVVARYLSPHEMGIFAISLATVGMLSLMQSFGLQPLIVREPVLNKSTTSTAFTINALISIVLCSLVIFFAHFGSVFFRDTGVKDVLLVLSISPLFGILSFLPGAQLERHARFKEMALITLITSFVGATTTIILAVLGFKYMSLAYASVLSSALLAIMLVLVGRSYFSCRIGIEEWRRVSEFGLQMFAASAIPNGSQRLNEMLLGRILGLGALGLFSRASSLNNMLWGNIHALVSRVVLVDFSSLQREGLPLRERYIQTVAMVTGILWPAFAGLALLAKPFIVTVYGEAWEAAAVPLTYLAISSMVLVSITMSWEICTVTGNLRTQTRVEAVRATCSVPLFIGGCLISLEAVAFSRIIDAVLAVALYGHHLGKMTGTTILDVRRVYAQGAALTIAAIAPAALLLAIKSDGQPMPAILISSVLLGVLLWVILLFILKHPLSREVIVTLGNRFPRLAQLLPG